MNNDTPVHMVLKAYVFNTRLNKKETREVVKPLPCVIATALSLQQESQVLD
jgi:hypothetical protein